MEVLKFKDVPTYDPNDPQFILVPEELPNGETIDVIYRKGPGGKSKEEMGEGIPHFSYIAPLNHRTYEAAPGITCMQDECCTLRDGVKIYADIFLPNDQEGPFPLIVSWGPFGKRAGEGEKPSPAEVKKQRSE